MVAKDGIEPTALGDRANSEPAPSLAAKRHRPPEAGRPDPHPRKGLIRRSFFWIWYERRGVQRGFFLDAGILVQ